MRNKQATQPDGPVAIVFSVKVTDGTFESNTSIPVASSAEEKQRAVARWLEIMQFGLKLSGDVQITQLASEPAP